jgi:hypothetical protein
LSAMTPSKSGKWSITIWLHTSTEDALCRWNTRP